MISRILVFEDDSTDQQRFLNTFESIGCEVLIVENPQFQGEVEAIKNFNPHLIVVDSNFDTEIDGIDIVRQLQNVCRKVPIIICSLLFDDVSKRTWLYNQYIQLPQVRRVIGKTPFPSGEDVIAYVSN